MCQVAVVFNARLIEPGWVYCWHYGLTPLLFVQQAERQMFVPKAVNDVGVCGLVPRVGNLYVCLVGVVRKHFFPLLDFWWCSASMGRECVNVSFVFLNTYTNNKVRAKTNEK